MTARSYFYTLSTFILFAVSCKNEVSSESKGTQQTGAQAFESPLTEAIDVDHNSQNSLDWAGTYYGTLPCHDCPGVETTLSLSLSGKFTLIENQVGKSKGSQMSGGVMGWNEQGSIVRLMGLKEDSDYHQYLVQENQLIKLAGTGEKFVGPDAAKYILRKTTNDPELIAINWKLKELKTYQGENLERSTPTLKIDQSIGQFSGYSSCNNFTGQLHIMEGKKINFGKMAVTRMACQDMKLEQFFINALENVSDYRFADGQLILGMPDYPDLMLFESGD